MQEIEAKVLEVDPDAVAAKLDDIGAEKLYDGKVRSRFYDFPDGSVEEQGVLRLRELEDHAFVTAKEDISRDGAKTMAEYEFDVDDPDAVAELFDFLGLEEIRESTKHRQKYVKDEVEYVIDSYPGIPPLLEVEAPDEEMMYAAFDELGFDREETVSWDAAEVKEHYS